MRIAVLLSQCFWVGNITVFILIGRQAMQLLLPHLMLFSDLLSLYLRLLFLANFVFLPDVLDDGFNFCQWFFFWVTKSSKKGLY